MKLFTVEIYDYWGDYCQICRLFSTYEKAKQFADSNGYLIEIYERDNWTAIISEKEVDNFKPVI